jgi:hypothetical protein
MTPTNQKCKHTGTATKRQIVQARSEEEIRYGKLWAEIELPKLLQERETNNKEVKQ